MSERVKVFGLGISKTGTTTLRECLIALGYRHKGTDAELTLEVLDGELRRALQIADEFESFDDWPWPLIYQQLAERYSNSKFILTVRRDSETWYRSLRKHFLRVDPSELRTRVFGFASPLFRKSEHIEFYERHNQAVRDFFRDKPNRLLEVCWETGSGWPELCSFIGCSIPHLPFPHANKAPRMHSLMILRRFARIVVRN